MPLIRSSENYNLNLSSSEFTGESVELTPPDNNRVSGGGPSLSSIQEEPHFSQVCFHIYIT